MGDFFSGNQNPLVSLNSGISICIRKIRPQHGKYLKKTVILNLKNPNISFEHSQPKQREIKHSNLRQAMEKKHYDEICTNGNSE